MFVIIKKFGFTKRAVIFLLAVSLPLSVFAGCQNKNSTENATSNPTANSGNNGSGLQNRTAPNLDQFKQRIEDNIKSLVDDKTITQDQADKIVAALTENMQGFGGQNRQRNNQNNGQNAQQNNNQGNTQNGQSNSQNSNQGNNQGTDQRQGGRQNSALSKLVTDGVITQAQADAVMQKIGGSFNRPQNNQNQPNNQNQQVNQNNQGA